MQPLILKTIASVKIAKMHNLRTKILFTVLNRHQKRLSSLDVPAARAYFEKISHTRFKPKLPHIYEDSVSSDGYDIALRVYAGNRAKPTIIYFHGGGFVVGSIDSHDAVARYLRKATGCSVVSVNYRLAPEFPSPAAIRDGLAAIAWLSTSALNKNFILAGDSAGAQIALMTAVALHEPQRQQLKALLLTYPALDPRLQTKSVQQLANGLFISKQNMQTFWKAYTGKGGITWPLPLAQIKKLPPTLIQTADMDLLRDEGRTFFEQLQTAGMAAVYHNYKHAAHGLLQMPNFASKRNQVLADIATFAAQHQ